MSGRNVSIKSVFFAFVAKLVDACALGAHVLRAWGFESLQTHNKIYNIDCSLMKNINNNYGNRNLQGVGTAC